jgi:4-hydroxybenzoyl-CoA reductase subunit beta
MRLPPFDYAEPKSLAEALTLKGEHQEAAKVLAGGTEAMVQMKLRLTEPKVVMNIKKIPGMSGLEEKGEEIVIGANTSLKEIAGSGLIKEKAGAVAEAARLVASPTIAAMATMAGNILQNTRCMYYDQSAIVLSGLEKCYKRGGRICLALKGSNRCFSVYQGDIAPALMACGGKVVLEKAGGTRTIPLENLFTGNGVNPLAIASDEILTRVILPKPKGAFASAYRKLRIRGSVDYPLTAAAAFIALTPDQKINAARIVIGAAGPAPRIVEHTLQGKSLHEAELNAVADQAYSLSEGVDNLTMPGAYRRKMVRVFTKRAILGAFQALKGGF